MIFSVDNMCFARILKHESFMIYIFFVFSKTNLTSSLPENVIFVHGSFRYLYLTMFNFAFNQRLQQHLVVFIIFGHCYSLISGAPSPHQTLPVVRWCIAASVGFRWMMCLSSILSRFGSCSSTGMPSRWRLLPTGVKCYC